MWWRAYRAVTRAILRLVALRRIVLSALAALALPSALIVAAAQAGSRTLSLAHALPSLIRQKDLVAVKGTITGVPRRTRVVLQLKRIDGRWTVPASTRSTRHGAFTIDWRVPASEDPGPVALRVGGLSRTHKLLVATKAVQSGIGQAAVPCAPPVPPAVDIPTGDGWIVGGAYGIGGAYPGIDACIGQQYTVTATNSSGQVTASETVPGGHSYTLAPLPAGSYTLQAGACRGTATVTAGEQTTANADCDYP
jgi:hypothetical protein